MDTIAILGAAGATGRSIGRELARRGLPVRATGRRLSRLEEAFRGSAVEMLQCDLETPEGAGKALEGAGVAVMALGLPYTEFRRYPALMQTVRAAAEQAAVRRFLLVTNIYAYAPGDGAPVTESHRREPVSFKGRMKLEQERILEGTGRMQWIILRLPDFFGPEAELSYAKTIFDSALKGARAQLFAPADTPHQFVYTDDVGPVVAGLLESATGWNEAYNFAGSGITTVEEFARKIYAAAGTPYRRMTVGRTVLRIMGLFQPMMREFGEMQYLQSTPVNLDDGKLVRLLGSVRRTSYEEGIAATLAAYRSVTTGA